VFAVGSPPRGSPAVLHHELAYALPASAPHAYPVHPTQLYEALAGLALLGLVLWVWRGRRFRGQPLLALVMGYGAFRFVVEHWRDDPERGALGGLSTSQLISLVLVPLAGFLYVQWNKAARDAGHPRVPTLRDAPRPEPPPGDASEAGAGGGEGARGVAAKEAGRASAPKRKRGARRP
jgi:phosphatidylglycerol:prolipoprotein diacylglycerol transferase